MIDSTIPTAVAAIGVVIAAGLALVGVLLAQLYARVLHLESKVETAQSYSRELWAYCRRILDLYYRHRRDGSPDPPPLPDEP